MSKALFFVFIYSLLHYPVFSSRADTDKTSRLNKAVLDEFVTALADDFPDKLVAGNIKQRIYRNEPKEIFGAFLSTYPLSEDKVERILRFFSFSHYSNKQLLLILGNETIKQWNDLISKYNDPYPLEDYLYSKYEEPIPTHFFSALILAQRIKQHPELGVKDKIEIHKSLMQLTNRFGAFDILTKKHDATKHYFLLILSGQLALNVLLDPLSSQSLGFHSDLFNFSQERQALLKKYGLLVLDNSEFGDREIKFLGDFASQLPTRFQFPISVLCAHCLFGQGPIIGIRPNFAIPSVIPWTSFISPSGIVLFNLPIGAGREYVFPIDCSSEQHDAFLQMTIHEFAHRIERELSSNPSFVKHRNSLLKLLQANPDLSTRNMFGESYFTKHGQELFASLANAYFANTQEFLNCAIGQARKGFSPIRLNEFYFMARTFAEQNKFAFYKTTPEGSIFKDLVSFSVDGNTISFPDLHGKTIELTIENDLIREFKDAD